MLSVIPWHALLIGILVQMHAKIEKGWFYISKKRKRKGVGLGRTVGQEITTSGQTVESRLGLLVVGKGDRIAGSQQGHQGMY
jgi:ABC-type sugar transport system ATPase subunit